VPFTTRFTAGPNMKFELYQRATFGKPRNVKQNEMTFF